MKNSTITYIYYDPSMDTDVHEEFKNWRDFVGYVEKYIESELDSKELAEFWNLVYDAMTFVTDNHVIIDLS